MRNFKIQSITIFMFTSHISLSLSLPLICADEILTALNFCRPATEQWLKWRNVEIIGKIFLRAGSRLCKQIVEQEKLNLALILIDLYHVERWLQYDELKFSSEN